MTLSQPPSAADRPVLGRTASRHPKVPALLLVLGGAVLVALAYTVLDWFHADVDATSEVTGGSTLSELHTLVSKIDESSRGALAPAPVAQYYFSWWAWALFAVVVLAALAATLPNRMSTMFGLLGTLLAAVAVVLTFAALKLSSIQDEALASFGRSYGEYLSHATLGFWLAVTGYLLAGAGALFGPPRKPKPLRI